MPAHGFEYNAAGAAVVPGGPGVRERSEADRRRPASCAVPAPVISVCGCPGPSRLPESTAPGGLVRASAA